MSLFGSLLFASGCSGPEAPPVPAPVAETPPVVEVVSPVEADEPSGVAEMESCLHWAGEEPYDDARGAEIAAGVAASCPAAVLAVKDHYGELRAQPASAALLVDFLQHMGASDGLEALGPDPALCDAAATHWKGWLVKNPDETYQPYFSARCPEQALAVCGPSRCSE